MVELKGTLLIIPCVAQNVKVHPLSSLPAKCSVSILLHTLHIRLKKKKKNLKRKEKENNFDSTGLVWAWFSLSCRN